MNGSEQIQKIADTYTNGRDAPKATIHPPPTLVPVRCFSYAAAGLSAIFYCKSGRWNATKSSRACWRRANMNYTALASVSTGLVEVSDAIDIIDRHFWVNQFRTITCRTDECCAK